jgi:GNAT superfamily N-acetyltransferase
MDTIGRINGAAYSLGGEFERALEGHSGAGLFTYTAGDGPDACVVLSDEGDDAAVWFVATTPAARGKGLSTALMAHGLADARERGLGTSTLQATDAGRPLYERLGYRSLGEIQMWERRK